MSFSSDSCGKTLHVFFFSSKTSLFYVVSPSMDALGNVFVRGTIKQNLQIKPHTIVECRKERLLSFPRISIEVSTGVTGIRAGKQSVSGVWCNLCKKVTFSAISIM